MDSSKQYQKIKDNQNSVIRDMLADAIDSLGGYHGDVFSVEDVGQRLSDIHSQVDREQLNIRTAQAKLGCLKIPKVEELVVNENSSLRDLNIAVLMTHWDYIAPVFFHRGVSLMGLKRWQNAISDFQMSLHHNYADGEYKLHHKIGMCFVKLKKYKSATKSFKTALDTLKSSDVDQKVRTQFTKILKECIAKFSAKPEEKLTAATKLSKITVTHPNKVDPRLHEAVEILEEVGKGRTAFAKSSIAVGTIIALDDAIGGHLNPDDPSKTLQFCVKCLRNVSIPYPCPYSPRVVYCSKKCQDEARDSFQKYQSQIDLYGMRQKDTKDGCSIFTSLSILTSKPASFWLEHHSRFLLADSPESEWPTRNISEVERMANMMDMCTNRDQVDHEKEARHSVTVVMLLRALRITSWYEDSGLEVTKEEGGALSKEEVVMGRLLHKIRLIKDMNAHPIWGVELNPRDPTNVGTENIGQGLYTAIASFFNSDCNPNTVRINMGTKMFLVASKNIRKGEEITDNYCIHFSDVPAAERRDWIEDHFKFSCECQACEDDWPTYSRIASDRPSEKIADKLVEMEMDNMTAMEKGDMDKALTGLAKEIGLIQAQLSEPHQLAVTVRTSFISCWWRKVGTMMQSPDTEL